MGARVIVTEIDPSTPASRHGGFEVTTVEDTLGRGDIYVTCTGNTDIITLDHMQRMKDQATCVNIGHFDNEIQVDRLNNSGALRTTSTAGGYVHVRRRPQHLLLAEGRLVTWAAPPATPARDEQQLCNQTLAQLDLWKNRDKYKPGVLHALEETRRGSGPVHLDQDRREADHAFRQAGRVSGLP